MTFTLAPELASIVRPGLLWLEGAVVEEHDPRLDAPLAHVAEAMRASPAVEVLAVRAMYKRVGIDPTKRRPSSEALLRRVMKGEGVPRVNSLVDVCNWCSLEFQLPYGLYDLAHVDGDIVLRIGEDGESYQGIRKDEVHVAGRIALADARGPFGNPTSDSARTMVTTSTTRVLVVVFAPWEVSAGHVERVLAVTADRMHQFTGARRTG